MQESFAILNDRWQELLETCALNQIFFTLPWQKAWWQVFGSDYEQLILSIYDERKLVGIAPLKRKDNTLSFIGSSDVCDYMDFIVQNGREEYVFSQLLRYLETLDWDNLELDSLLEQSPTIKFLAPLASNKGYQVEIRQMNVSPQVILPSGWDDYLTSLTGKDRHEIRRKLRRLEQSQSVNYLTITEKDKMAEAMQSFFQLFQLSSAEKANFMTPKKKDFLQQ